jgi:hypothetical protein
MKIPHMSMAPPALESPSRFAPGAIVGTEVSPRSRRARTLRLARRAAWSASAMVALALALAACFGLDAVTAAAARAWSVF